MILLLEVLAVLAVVFGVAVVLTGRAEGLSEEQPDRAATGIPRDRPMTAEDVVGLRFALALRGYRMDEVDDALDRLAAEVAARDEAIERLRASLSSSGAAPDAAVPDVAPDAAPDAAPDVAVPDVAVPHVAVPDLPSLPTAPGTEVAEDAEDEAAAPAETTASWSALDPEVPVASLPEVAEPANPFRPDVPEIKTYDPWSVTPRSRYTDGPTYVEVEHPEDDEHVEAMTEHQTGYAPVLGDDGGAEPAPSAISIADALADTSATEPPAPSEPTVAMPAVAADDGADEEPAPEPPAPAPWPPWQTQRPDEPAP